MKTITGRKENLIISVLWLLAVLVMIKSIFTDFGYDNAYQIAMSYRHIQGDRMLLEMWEPHQTSMFFNDILLLVYRVFVPSLTGVALFTQVIGTLVSVLIGATVLRALKGKADRLTGHALLVFLVIFKVKQSPFMDYALQTILLSLLVFAFLLQWEETGKQVYPIFAGVFTFLEVLSYPTAIITLIPAIVFLVTGESEKKAKGLLSYIAGGGVPAVIYAAYFTVTIGLSRMTELAGLIIDSDSHSTTPHFGEYWTPFFQAITVAAACIGLAVLICLVSGRQKKVSVPVISMAIMAVAEPVLLFVTRNRTFDVRCFIYLIPALLILSGAAVFTKMTGEEKRVWLLGVALSFSTFIAALVLSDLGILTICAYLVLGGAVSFIPLKYLCTDHRQLAVLVACLILFHRGLVVWGYGNTNGRVMLTTELQNIVREGPALGIMCDHMNKAKFSTDYSELRARIKADDRVLIVGPELMDPFVFMYTDAEISNYSVIDTPKYNEALKRYFELNPGKTPTVVLADCWFGNLSVPADSYIMKWVEDRYDAVEDLSYYRIYR